MLATQQEVKRSGSVARPLKIQVIYGFCVLPFLVSAFPRVSTPHGCQVVLEARCHIQTEHPADGRGWLFLWVALSVPQQTCVIGQDQVDIDHGKFILGEEDAAQATRNVCSRNH